MLHNVQTQRKTTKLSKGPIDQTLDLEYESNDKDTVDDKTLTEEVRDMESTIIKEPVFDLNSAGNGNRHTRKLSNGGFYHSVEDDIFKTVYLSKSNPELEDDEAVRNSIN